MGKQKMSKKDTMHDFGVLGKWSESTLKENMLNVVRIAPKGSNFDATSEIEVNSIERLFRSLIEDLEYQHEGYSLGCNEFYSEIYGSAVFKVSAKKKVKNLTVSEMLSIIELYQENKAMYLKDLNKIKSDYDKYRKVMNKVKPKDIEANNE